jgi:PAS domain S-box-containing protein
MEATFPANEQARLAALDLYRVLDTLPEQSYDDLTHLASSICDTPMALITFIDQERQWFKAKVGVDVDETPRAEAFCAHTILQPQEMLIVPDGRQDSRFADNPFVQGEQGIRFYAGAPLVTSDGYALGTICVIDKMLRQLTAQQKHSLQALARQVMVHLELRRSKVQLEQTHQQQQKAEQTIQKSEERFRSLIQHSSDMTGLVSREGIQLYASPSVKQWLGYEPDELVGKNVFALIHPEDLPRIQSSFAVLLTGEQVEAREFRLRAADGQWHWLDTVATNMLEHPSVEAIIINSRDVTQRKQVEEASHFLASIVQSSEDSILTINFDRVITSWNKAAESLYGYRAEEVLGQDLTLLTLPKDLEQVLRNIDPIKHSQKVESFDTIRVNKGGRELQLEVVLSPVKDTAGEVIGVSTIARDITQRKQVEQELRLSEMRYRALFESNPHPMWVYDRVTLDFLAVNKAAVNHYGYSRDEFLSMTLKDFQSPEEISALLGYVSTPGSADGKQSLRHHQKKDGTVIDVEITSHDLLFEERRARLTLANDVTNRRAAEKQISFQAHLLNEVGQAVIATDTQGTVVYWNRYAETLYGWSVPDAVGKKITTLTVPEMAVTQAEEILATLARGERWSGEFTVQRRDGTTFLAAVTNMPVYDEAGALSGIIGISRDITRRKQAEAAIRLSEERYRSLTQATAQIIWAVAPDGQAVEEMLSWQSYTGQSMEECQGWGWLDAIHPADHESTFQAWTQSVKTQSLYEAEYRLRGADGNYRLFAVRGVPVLDADGKIREWVGTCTDIHDRRAAEEERDRFFSLSLDMLCIIGSDGYIKRLNPAFEATLGFSDAEMKAVPFMEFVHPEDHAATREAVKVVEGGSRLWSFENRYRCRDGSFKWMRWMVAPFEDLWYCVAHDVTGVKETEAALQQANEDLEMRVRERTAEVGAANESLRIENIEHQMTMATLREVAEALQRAKEEADIANAAKSEFLSRMSHELRTPLNAILGFGQLLEREKLTPLQSESIGFILSGGRHLLGLINEVLDIARVESGHIELSLEPIALGDIVPEACILMQHLAAERQIKVDENTAKLGHTYVMADRQRLKQVLINLLANAIKYNRESGQVEVICEHTPDGCVSIAVRDTGTGISPQDLSKLFTPFERLGAANSEIEGTGLGLVLSQRLMTVMGGTLTVESTLGQGTTFTVSLPRTTSPEEQLTNWPEENGPQGSASLHAGQPDQNTCSVLCIEDNPSNLRLMEAIFESRPEITLLTAIQGSIGLDLARQHEPDLILLDLNLPDIHGSEVLTRLQQSALTRDIPVVIISADATPNQVERLLAAGAKAYLTKPLNVGELLQVTDKFLQAPTDTTSHDPRALQG